MQDGESIRLAITFKVDTEPSYVRDIYRELQALVDRLCECSERSPSECDLNTYNLIHINQEETHA